MNEQLKRRGFVEHDGNLANHYSNNQYIEVIYKDGMRTTEPRGWFESHGLNDRIKYHRLHISERAQLDMAIHALQNATVAADMDSKPWRGREHALATLQTLKERQTNDE